MDDLDDMTGAGGGKNAFDDDDDFFGDNNTGYDEKKGGKGDSDPLAFMARADQEKKNIAERKLQQ